MSGVEEIRNIEWATYGETLIHPVALFLTLIAGLVMLTGRRNWSTLPMLLVAVLIPFAQRLVILTLDFNMIRILVLFGWGRILLRREVDVGRLNALDIAVVVWCTVGTIFYLIREPDFGSLLYRFGFCFEFLGVYFVVRNFSCNQQLALNAVRSLAFCTLLVSIGMTIEWLTRYNLFSIFGGVPEITMDRGGRLRCQGAFSHPILAGSFGATMLPMLIGGYLAYPRHRGIMLAGIVSALIIVVTSSSSGPLFALVAGMGVWALWSFRKHIRLILWGLFAAVLVVHFVREKPFWHLIGRASDFVGGAGYHRVQLIDAFLDNFRDWILYGTNSMAYWGYGLQDITNQYVLEGVNGGLATLLAFIAVIVIGYRTLSYQTRHRQTSSKIEALWKWGLGASLTAHVVAFIGVSYFGQMYVFFALSLALISAHFLTTQNARNPVTRKPGASISYSRT